MSMSHLHSHRSRSLHVCASFPVSLIAPLKISLLLCSFYLPYTTLGVDNLAFHLSFFFFPLSNFSSTPAQNNTMFPPMTFTICNLHCIMCPCTKAKNSLKSNVTLTQFLQNQYFYVIIALEVYVTLGSLPYLATQSKKIKYMSSYNLLRSIS